MAVYVNGNEVEQESGLKHAADLLGKAKLPVIGGLMTDIAGAKQAIALAEKLGGVVDHMAGEEITRASRVAREAGTTPSSLGELRNRSDVVVLLGDGALSAEPELLQKIFPEKETLPRPGDAPRELIAIGSDAKAPGSVKTTTVSLGNQELVSAIGILAAAVAKRPIRDADVEPAKSLMAVAETIRNAAYAVFVYSPKDLNEPAMNVVLDTVRSMCETTRAAIYSPPAPGNGTGVNLCSIWTCGMPVRTSFAHKGKGHIARPEHDAWHYSAERLIADGEGDCLLWVNALGTAEAAPPKGAPTVILANRQAADPHAAEVVVEVAVPGQDHDAALYLVGISGIGMVEGAQGSGLPSVAEIISGIAERIE